MGELYNRILCQLRAFNLFYTRGILCKCEILYQSNRYTTARSCFFIVPWWISSLNITFDMLHCSTKYLTETRGRPPLKLCRTVLDLCYRIENSLKGKSRKENVTYRNNAQKITYYAFNGCYGNNNNDDDKKKDGNIEENRR